MTLYRGIVVLSEVVGHYPNAVCGLLTTYSGSTTYSGVRLVLNRAPSRTGGRETTNGT